MGWFQGAMEYGPRALGGRSILADPRTAASRDRLNGVVKRRESFRPFAPSVKADRVRDYFEVDDSPFMSFIVPVRAEMRSVLGAVTDVDGTARPQTVERARNALYWSVLDRFEALTGHPVVLNTSFNVDAPIACTPDDALATAEGSGMDAMAMGNWWGPGGSPS